MHIHVGGIHLTKNTGVWTLLSECAIKSLSLWERGRLVVFKRNELESWVVARPPRGRNSWDQQEDTRHLAGSYSGQETGEQRFRGKMLEVFIQLALAVPNRPLLSLYSFSAKFLILSFYVNPEQLWGLKRSSHRGWGWRVSGLIGCH